MRESLPSRPDLDHLRRQAKSLLSRLRAGDREAAQTFIDHLPDAHALTPEQVLARDLRLADAHSAIARRAGFASWPGLARHVRTLRALEGEWGFTSLEVDGHAVPAAMIADSRLLIDGDRFRTESPEAVYEGEFTIDAEAEPATIDIAFVAGPEAGRTSLGLFHLDADRLTICLGLAGATRPGAFATAPDTSHALEVLERRSAARPAGVTGGTPPAASASAPPAGDANEAAPMTDGARALLARLAGEWSAVALALDGRAMPAAWLAAGSRTLTGDELRIVFGGQTMVHARVRLDDSRSPVAVDYHHLSGPQAGHVSEGVMAWDGDEVCFLMAAPGRPRPADVAQPPGPGLTYSRWRRR